MGWRIRDRATFEALRRAGPAARRGPVTVTFVACRRRSVPGWPTRWGKRVGGAVVRNRLRRRLRAAVAERPGVLAPGAYLVAAGPERPGLPYEDLKAQVTSSDDSGIPGPAPVSALSIRPAEARPPSGSDVRRRAGPGR